MTCIVGLKHGGKVWLGGDSAGLSGYDLTIRADRKVFVNEGFVMGFTTSFRMGQLLQHTFKPPKRHAAADVEAFMAVDFVNAVRDCLKAGGFAKKSSEQEEGGDFLVGYEGRLFAVLSDYQVAESGSGFYAVGCGAAYALGALFANERNAPRTRIKQALEAAEAMSGGVRGPFHIESV